MSGWLDLIGIGIDVAQSHQIYKAREELGQLQAGAQAEAARKLILEMMRNFVFEIVQDIKVLEDHIQTAPQQVYVVARALEWRLQDSGISPDIFPDFTDKEYVQQAFTRIKSAVQQSRGRLSEGQLTQAETAINYITETGLLTNAIEAKSAAEKLQATEAEWNDLSKQAGRASGHKTLGCLGLIATFLFVPQILVIAVTVLWQVHEILGALAGLVAVGIWLTLLVGSITLRGKKPPVHYETMKAEREELQQKLLPRDVWDKVVHLWGDLSSQGYREIQTTRANFLRGVFGQVEGFDKFLPSGN